MYLLDAKQIKEWDNITLQEQNITGLQLMQRAGQALTNEMTKELLDLDNPVYVICGSGNNGGDGLVIARLLRNLFFNVKVIEVGLGSNSVSAEYLEMRKQLVALGNVSIETFQSLDTLKLNSKGLIIDALLGAGVNRPPEGKLSELIHFINALNMKVFAVDLPSGMQIGLTPSALAIRASKVFTIQSPKLPFFLEENWQWMGSYCTVDIGLSKNFKPHSPYQAIDVPLIRSFCQPRNKVSHKGHYGHAAIVAGDRDTAGAAILAAGAATRSGAGWITLFSRSEINDIALTLHPEIMTRAIELLPENASFTKFDALGIGCGLSTRPTSIKWLHCVIHHPPKYLILDADALNILSSHPLLIEKLPQGTIITPHPGEFDRLFGPHAGNSDRIHKQIQKSKELGWYIVLKTSITSISTPEGDLYFNTCGNPGMAKAGSGDVLLGLMTGLLARWKNPLHAACMAVFLHGTAGDLACEMEGPEAMRASDIIQNLSKAYRLLEVPNSNVH